LTVHLPRRCDIWLAGYVRTRLGQWLNRPDPRVRRRVWVTIADHFEPLAGGVSRSAASDCVLRWRRCWPEIAARHADSSGRRPVYTFFYPEEEYHPTYLEPLAEMTADGIAEVEVHLHHEGETAQHFVDRVGRFTTTLSARHGLLRREAGRIRFGFIHGNWALANSLPGGRWCGVKNEIRLLRDLGCYADFTMPSGALESQARLVNRLYWAIDTGDGRKAHDTGILLQPGRPAGDLLMIPGPLGLRYRERLLPRMETGEIAVYDPPTPYRVRRWLAIAPRIGNDIFIKLFTHGAQARHIGTLLDGGLTTLFDAIAAACRQNGFDFYYVSAWQMYRTAMAVWTGRNPLASADSSEPATVEVRL
jgi:hypothetical protein